MNPQSALFHMSWCCLWLKTGRIVVELQHIPASLRQFLMLSTWIVQHPGRLLNVSVTVWCLFQRCVVTVKRSSLCEVSEESSGYGVIFNTSSDLKTYLEAAEILLMTSKPGFLLFQNTKILLWSCFSEAMKWDRDKIYFSTFLPLIVSWPIFSFWNEWPHTELALHSLSLKSVLNCCSFAPEP